MRKDAIIALSATMAGKGLRMDSTDCIGWLLEQRFQQHGWMHRLLLRKVMDLMPAGSTRRHYGRGRILAAHLRKKPSLADLPRHLEMLLRVAERAGHAAAAGIQVNH